MTRRAPARPPLCPRSLPQRVSPVVDLLAGSSSGATAVILTYPLDFVRTRLAYTMEANRRECRPQTIRGILRMTLQGEGLTWSVQGHRPQLIWYFAIRLG